jgi:hypothetical protein
MPICAGQRKTVADSFGFLIMATGLILSPAR